MSNPHFEELRRKQLDALEMEYSEYRHTQTGARHIHLSADTSLNAFMVAFHTRPENDRGAPHILEHVVMQGSRRFPVRGTFFKMLKRSFASFMNAMTGAVVTQYPFCSPNERDFYNLLEVYLDAVFFPLLSPYDFMQEGHRLEFSEAEDPKSPLTVRGVVHNEMKGNFASPAARMSMRIDAHLYEHTPLRFNSGGDPRAVPELSFEEFKAFHERCYHPSNAILLTCGRLPAEDLQERFHELALNEFGAREPLDLLPRETRFDGPRAVEEAYPVDTLKETGQHAAALSWLLDPVESMEQRIEVEFLLKAAATGRSSPLMQFLLASGLGGGPYLAARFNGREPSFSAGLVGTGPAGAERLQGMIMQVLERLAEDGPPPEALKTALHQMELRERSTEDGDHMPYVLDLLSRLRNQAMLGRDPLDGIHVAPFLERLRERIEDPAWFAERLRYCLLDNPHRLNLVLSPDPEMVARELEEERLRLEGIHKMMSTVDAQHLVDEARELRRLQNLPGDEGCLPMLHLDDIPTRMRECPCEILETEGLPLYWYGRGTNGLAYQELSIQLPPMDPALLEKLSLACDFLPLLGCGDLDHRRAVERQQSICGDFHSELYLRPEVDGEDRLWMRLNLSGQALYDRHADFADFLRQVTEEADFSDRERVGELVSLAKASLNHVYSGSQPIQLALTSASAGFNAATALRQRLEGLDALLKVKELESAGEALEELCAEFERIRTLFIDQPRSMLLAGEPEARKRLQANVERTWRGCAVDGARQAVESAKPSAATRLAWVGNTSVNFNAVVFPGVSMSHPDRPRLKVLGRLIQQEHLFRSVREEGGAYGVGFVDGFGVAGFGSFRDPRIGGTLKDFLQAGEWFLESAPDDEVLERAVLSVISDLDKPSSVVVEARKDFHRRLMGFSSELRGRIREQAMSLSWEDLRRTAETYLRPEAAGIAVLCGREALSAEKDLDLEVREIW